LTEKQRAVEPAPASLRAATTDCGLFPVCAGQQYPAAAWTASEGRGFQGLYLTLPTGAR
jgi:hypothetical protein